MQGSPRIDELRQKFHENPRRYFAPLANEYRKAGDPEQAIAICRAHLAQQPGHMSGHVVYGQALYDAKRPDEARVVFEKALSLDPDNAIVLRQLGDIAREKGDNAEAKHWYSRAIDADPGDREVAAYIAELTEPITADSAAQTESSQEPVATEAPAETPSDAETPPESGTASESEIATETEIVTETETAPETGMPAEPVEEIAVAAETAAERENEAAPRPEESPFVTRTMAELYAKQGYRSAALDVYRQLAIHHPDDREIADRIQELSRETVEPSSPEPTIETVEKVAEVQAEALHAESPPPNNEASISDEDFAFQELDNEIVFAPTDEDLNLVTEAKPPQPEKHFTEVDLGNEGDSWDTDSWAAGFSEDEALSPEFDSPELRAEVSEGASEDHAAETEAAEAEMSLDQAGAEPVAELEAKVESPAQPQSVAEVEPIAQAEPEPVQEPQLQAEPEPEPQLEPQPEPQPETVEAVVEHAPEPEPIVAYSPELPEEEELPHYAPKGPTVREFFATLGAKRPPSSNSITARAAVPEIRSQPQSSESDTTDLPLATDAFANMFASEPVNEDDARAAFTLSGALAASETQTSRTPTPPRPAPAQDATPAVPATTEESEEDIRRFREWLDGLSES